MPFPVRIYKQLIPVRNSLLQTNAAVTKTCDRIKIKCRDKIRRSNPTQITSHKQSNTLQKLTDSDSRSNARIKEKKFKKKKTPTINPFGNRKWYFSQWTGSDLTCRLLLPAILHKNKQSSANPELRRSKRSTNRKKNVKIGRKKQSNSEAQISKHKSYVITKNRNDPSPSFRGKGSRSAIHCIERERRGWAREEQGRRRIGERESGEASSERRERERERGRERR